MPGTLNPGVWIAPTFRAATAGSVVAAAGSAMFFVISGSATRTIAVQRIRASGPTLTAVEYDVIVCEKWSSAPTGGTATTLTKVPMDSGVPAGLGPTATLVQVYTVAPAEGVLIGTVGAVRLLSQATTAAAAGLLSNADFDFRPLGGSSPVYLKGTAEALSLAFAAAPATAVTLTVEVEWVELP